MKIDLDSAELNIVRFYLKESSYRLQSSISYFNIIGYEESVTSSRKELKDLTELINKLEDIVYGRIPSATSK